MTHIEQASLRESNPYLFSNEKRVFDIVAGSVLAIASYPIETAAIIALYNSLDSGPLYLHQERFKVTLTKLRTMLSASPEETYTNLRASSNTDDPRVPAGFPATARKFRIDEIPQFRQAVRGGIVGDTPRMSLVGMRPLLEQHVDEFYEEAQATNPDLANRWRNWQNIAPRGAFSPAAINFMDRDSNEGLDILEWVTLEDRYCRTASLNTDISIVNKGLTRIARAVAGTTSSHSA